ncbi:DUF4145 domain-containing protein [Photobacterium leiognathi]|uniref:DUF4145 domain-containing protein n=1 Tax=Photobacterium leiognathi TaxID=553611 RepID=UPI002980CF9F|nr:DUF4145 domain-containing protein [Photobacterium leiognathi]
MVDIEQVIDRSRRIEDLLRHHYHAKGSDLQQLIGSCEDRLPHDVLVKLEKVAELNKQFTSSDGRVDSSDEFIQLCDWCEKELAPRSSRLVWGVAITLLCGFTLAAIWFYTVNWHHIKF